MTFVAGPGRVGEQGPDAPRCAEMSRSAAEPMAGTAPTANVWVAVEHPDGWADAPLARSEHGVRVVMARSRRPEAAAPGTSPDPHLARRGVRVWVCYVAADPVLRVGRVDSPADVAGWDLAAVADGAMRLWGELDPDPLLLVCANGRRDRCCGHSGGRLADTLWRGAHRDRVLTCTHLGGHRFAPTALLLPAGALHGRLDEESGTDLLAGAAQGRMRYDTLRGFSQLAPAAQVADVHARARHGYLGTTALQIDLVPGPGPEQQQARAHIPDTHRPPIIESFALTRTSSPTILGCGRAPEQTTRWNIA